MTETFINEVVETVYDLVNEHRFINKDTFAKDIAAAHTNDVIGELIGSKDHELVCEAKQKIHDLWGSCTEPLGVFCCGTLILGMPYGEMTGDEEILALNNRVHDYMRKELDILWDAKLGAIQLQSKELEQRFDDLQAVQ